VPYAVVFPGQGAAVPAAGEAWRSHEAWSIVEQAEAHLQAPLARLLLEAQADELATTRASQMAVLLTSLVAWTAFADRVDEPPVAFAGHSLGQITALIAAGAVAHDDGLRLAARRAEVSQDSADAHPGKMAALMGADIPTAERICADLDVWIANDNAPGQVVIAGTSEGLDQAIDRAKASGVRKVIPLAVGHAFHTPLLTDAAEALRPLLDSLAFAEPSAPIVTNTDALAHTDPACWPEQLTRHLVEPVRWRECQDTLADLGIDTIVEIGPGRVLTGLARRTVPGVAVVNVTTPADVNKAADQLAGSAAHPDPVPTTPSVTGSSAPTDRPSRPSLSTPGSIPLSPEDTA
jgi:[acyl-carrier-protein] S-malonyltransferase